MHANSVPGDTGQPVIEVELERLADEARHLWISLTPVTRATTVILAATPELEADIQDTFGERKVMNSGIVIERLLDRGLDARQLADPSSYEEGDALIFVKTSYGCAQGALTTVLGARGTTVEHMDANGRCRTFRRTKPTARNLRLHDTQPFALHTSDRIRVPGVGLATVTAIEGRTVELDTGEGSRYRLRCDDHNLRLLTPGWSHVGHETRSAIVVLDSGDPAGQASFARDATRTFDECVVLTDDREDLLVSFRQHHTDALLQAWSRDPADRELMPAMAMLDSSGDRARQTIREHAAGTRLIARIDAHCRAWTDTKSTPRAAAWMDDARSLLQEARERRLAAAAARLDDLCERQEAMGRRASRDVRFSIR